MKNLTYATLFTLFFLSTSQAVVYADAHDSEKAHVEEKMIYCPQEITCSKTGDISSCTYINETTQYWGKFDSVMHLTLSKGTYTLWRVRSGYHNNYAYTDCNYIYRDPNKGEQVLDLIAKNGAFLEANFSRDSQWTDGGMNGINCQSSDAKSCPLNEASGLGVVYTEIDVNKYSITSSVPYINLDGRRFSISYDNATSCWGLKHCKINFNMTSKDAGCVAIGSVVIDMDNKMKIVEIDPIDESGVTINKIEGLNAIEITKLNDSATISSVEIVNSTGSEINIFSADILVSTINAWDHGGIFSNRMPKNCSELKGCVAEFKSKSGGVIGSIVIDVKNKMNVLSAQATRSSEIAIHVVEGNKVEVSYH